MPSHTTLPYRMHSDEGCYFAFPLVPQDEKLEDFAKWQAYASHVERAKLGFFESIPSLLDVYDGDAHWVRRGAYVKLMGDAGPSTLLEHIHALLHNDIPYDYALDFMETLFFWGRLDVVPTLINAWRLIYTGDDADYTPPRISLLIEPDPCEHWKHVNHKSSAEEADEYRDKVLARHAELRDELGEHAFVFRGRRLDIEWVLRCALSDLATGKLDPEMRHKIEAMTGIDCSSFYRDGLQPLAAAALLEDMLASLDLFPFVPGLRYFFGHAVP